jgi:hypothetical protein
MSHRWTRRLNATEQNGEAPSWCHRAQHHTPESVARGADEMCNPLVLPPPPRHGHAPVLLAREGHVVARVQEVVRLAQVALRSRLGSHGHGVACACPRPPPHPPPFPPVPPAACGADLQVGEVALVHEKLAIRHLPLRAHRLQHVAQLRQVTARHRGGGGARFAGLACDLCSMHTLPLAWPVTCHLPPPPAPGQSPVPPEVG